MPRLHRLGEKCFECDNPILELPHDCPGRKQKKFVPGEIHLTLETIVDIDRHLGIKD